MMAAASLLAPQQHQQPGISPSAEMIAGNTMAIPSPPELFHGVKLRGLPFSATKEIVEAFLVSGNEESFTRPGRRTPRGNRAPTVLPPLSLGLAYRRPRKTQNSPSTPLSTSHTETEKKKKKPSPLLQAPTECVDVLLVTRANRPSGEAFVVLGGGPAALLSAVARNRSYLGRRYIEVFAARRGEYYRAVASEVARGDLAGAGGAYLALPPSGAPVAAAAAAAALPLPLDTVLQRYPPAAIPAAAAAAAAALQISPQVLLQQQLMQQEQRFLQQDQHFLQQQQQQERHQAPLLPLPPPPPPPPRLPESLLELAAAVAVSSGRMASTAAAPFASTPAWSQPRPNVSTVAALAAVNAAADKAARVQAARDAAAASASVARASALLASASAGAASSPSGGLPIAFGGGFGVDRRGFLSSNSDAGGSAPASEAGRERRRPAPATAAATAADGSGAAGEPSPVLRLRGLPFSADEEVVRSWISDRLKEKMEAEEDSGGGDGGSDGACGSPPPPPSSSSLASTEAAPTLIILLRSREGKSSGQAHVCFDSAEAAGFASRACDRAHFGQRYIEVFWVRAFFFFPLFSPPLRSRSSERRGEKLCSLFCSPPLFFRNHFLQSSPAELERACSAGQQRGRGGATAREHEAMLGRIDRNLLLALSAGVGAVGRPSSSSPAALSPSYAQLLESRSLGSAAVFGGSGSRGAMVAAAAALASPPPLLLSPERAAAAALAARTAASFGAFEAAGAVGRPPPPPPPAPQSPPMRPL